MSTEIILLIVFGLWLAGVSIALFWLYSFFNKLTGKKNDRGLKKILEDIIKTKENNIKEVEDLRKRVNSFEKTGKGHVQKIGLVRFNPFDETGGDQSFSLAILDGEDNGIVLTGLHTRERTRIYTKNVVKGKGEIEFSKEEKKALFQAKKK